MSYPEIYFLRHGETEWNRTHRFQGQTDVPLNETGRSQATRNGLALADLIDAPQAYHYVSSPLSRTMDTMRIARRHLGLAEDGFATDDRLRELSFGRWEGLTRREMAAADPELHDAFFADPDNHAPPGGESHNELRARVAAFLADLRGPSIVVAHGGTFRALVRLACGVDEPTSFVKPVPQDKIVLIRDGGVSFL